MLKTRMKYIPNSKVLGISWIFFQKEAGRASVVIVRIRISSFRPAPANHGYKFCRTDLPGAPLIDALADHVTETSRGTTLVQNNASVSTIEHVLAALYGLRIDNALIELDGPEAPIMGGSAWKFTQALKSAGFVEQKDERNYFRVKQKSMVSLINVLSQEKSKHNQIFLHE